MSAYRNTKDALRARTEACRCAATVLAGRPDLDIIPTAFSLCVFFESYIAEGSATTAAAWGPKKPVKLKAVAVKRSRILKNVRASAKGLHGAGLLSAATMGQFDQLTQEIPET